MTFMVSTMMIALPSGDQNVQLAGHDLGRPDPIHHADAFSLSFVSMFIIGGLSGIFMAATPVDIYIHDTYFIVAHFHYVLFAGTAMGVFGGDLFLVSQDVRPDDERVLGQGPFLPDVHLLQRHVLTRCTSWGSTASRAAGRSVSPSVLPPLAAA